MHNGITELRERLSTLSDLRHQADMAISCQ